MLLSTVKIVDLTYGEKCESPLLWNENPDISVEEVKDIRREEIQAAADVLGAPIECLDYDDSPLIVGPERRAQILEVIRGFQPDLVLCCFGIRNGRSGQQGLGVGM